MVFPKSNGMADGKFNRLDARNLSATGRRKAKEFRRKFWLSRFPLVSDNNRMKSARKRMGGRAMVSE